MASKAIEIKSDSVGVSIDGIMDDYFQQRFPFENSEKKKSEFPDAVIAAQLKRIFSDSESVCLVTKDNGLKKALNGINYVEILSSLDELFKLINERNTEIANGYDAALSQIEKLLSDISIKISDELGDDERITLEGYSYDKDGIVSGYEYEDVDYYECDVEGLEIGDIDYIDQDCIIARLVCTAHISAECSYYDYDSAVWDDEEKEYVFLEKRTNIEKHKTVFPVRVVFDINDNMSFKILDFRVSLDENSRMDVEEVNFEQPEAKWS